MPTADLNCGLCVDSRGEEKRFGTVNTVSGTHQLLRHLRCTRECPGRSRRVPIPPLSRLERGAPLLCALLRLVSDTLGGVVVVAAITGILSGLAGVPYTLQPGLSGDA